MDKRLYPIERNLFDSLIQPTIEKSYIWKGRPPKISHYQVFCAILYVLRTGIPWRDLPKDLNKKSKLLDSIPGVGEKTISIVLAFLIAFLRACLESFQGSVNLFSIMVIILI